MRKIFKHEIPVDGQWHDILLTGPIVHVDAQAGDTVRCWAIDDDEATPTPVPLRAFGTGHTIDGRTPVSLRASDNGHEITGPDGHEMRYIGTGVVPQGPYIIGAGLVWHLVAAVDIAQADAGKCPLDWPARWSTDPASVAA